MMQRLVGLALLVAALVPDNARAEAGELLWLGKSALSEVRWVEVDCGDAAYKFVTEHNRRGAKLLVIEREPDKFSDSVEASIRSLFGEFFSIDPLRFSCGAGPKEGDRENLRVLDRNLDFSGQLRIELNGYHRSDIRAAQEKCRESGGEFEPKTWRMIVVSRDEFDARPGVIGRRFDRSSTREKRGDN